MSVDTEPRPEDAALPCPFCGSVDVDINGQDDLYVTCVNCLADGPAASVGCRGEDDDEFDLEREAVELWNQRILPVALTVEGELRSKVSGGEACQQCKRVGCPTLFLPTDFDARYNCERAQAEAIRIERDELKLTLYRRDRELEDARGHWRKQESRFVEQGRELRSEVSELQRKLDAVNAFDLLCLQSDNAGLRSALIAAEAKLASNDNQFAEALSAEAETVRAHRERITELEQRFEACKTNDHEAGLREWRAYSARHKCTDSGDKWAAFCDGFDRGAAYARATEPPQPASVAHVCIVCGKHSGVHPTLCFDHDPEFGARSDRPASVGGVSADAVLCRVADSLNATAFFNAGIPLEHVSTALMVARRIVEDVETELYELSKKAKPAEPPHPRNEELVATLGASENHHWPLCEARRCCRACMGWADALSALERRLTQGGT